MVTWGNWNSNALLLGMRRSTSTQKNYWAVLNKVTENLPQDPVIVLADAYPKDMNMGFQQKLVHECTWQLDS